MSRISLFLCSLALALTGCGSLPGAGPFYQEVSATCSSENVSASCTTDSGSVGFAREKLARYSQHFTSMAEKRSDATFTAGNVGIGSSLVGVIAAASQSREGVIASALVGVPTALYAQRYNLAGQGPIYLRGVRNFQCMRNSLRQVQDFKSLYDRVPQAERAAELTAANTTYQSAPRLADGRIDDVVLRTRTDLINGVSAVDVAAIATAFERYAKDLKSAQEKISKATLYNTTGIPTTVAAGGPPPLTDDEKTQLQTIAVKLKTLSTELEQCVAL